MTEGPPSVRTQTDQLSAIYSQVKLGGITSSLCSLRISLMGESERAIDGSPCHSSCCLLEPDDRRSSENQGEIISTDECDGSRTREDGKAWRASGRVAAGGGSSAR